MVFKKFFHSDKPIILNKTDAISSLFPPGYSYRLGSLTFTVKKDVTEEKHSPKREVITSDGSTEILDIETIIKDLKQSDCVVLPFDERYAIKPDKKEKQTKVTKKVKKTASKKVIKKNKNG